MTQNSEQWPLRAAQHDLNPAHTLTYQQFMHLEQGQAAAATGGAKGKQAPEVADLVPATLSTPRQPNTPEHIFFGISDDLQLKIA